MKLKIQIGTWYTLSDYLRPNDRSRDCQVQVVDVDRKVVHFETRPAPGCAKGTPLSLPKAAFLGLATICREVNCHEDSR